MFNSNMLKSEINFYGIAKAIELLNNKLEQCSKDDVDNIVYNIIKLDEQLNKYKNKNIKAFINKGDNNEI